MADRMKGNSGGGGGGGRGGGGEIIESTFASDGGGSDSTFHKLLPNIAEAVETLEVATVEDVQKKIEETTSVKYTKSELILGLENGRQLGLFELERQFSLNAKYINEELKASKGDIGKIKSLVRKRLQEERTVGNSDRRRRSGGRVRTKSRKCRKSNRDEEWSPSDVQRSEVKMCERCKKKISSLTVESGSDTGVRDSDSDLSVASEVYKTKKAGLRSEMTNAKRKKVSSPEPQKSRQPQKKSKLLVERNNPLENDPPYYDIFT